MNQAEYFGYGPHESYIDKRRASYLGKFTSRVCDLHEDYMRPQENGSHYHCEYVSVADDSRKLTVYNEQPISFNLSEYTEEELTTKGHNYELEKSGYTVFLYRFTDRVVSVPEAVVLSWQKNIVWTILIIRSLST